MVCSQPARPQTQSNNEKKNQPRQIITTQKKRSQAKNEMADRQTHGPRCQAVDQITPEERKKKEILQMSSPRWIQ